MKTLRTAALAALLAAAGTAQAFDLTVEVMNVRSADGFVAAAIYAAEGGWLKDGQAVQAQRVPAGEKAVIVYRNLPAGRYAVSAFHDENGNGRLDRNVLGIPSERYGFSRDARGTMGPPAFGDAGVELEADTTITIHLQ